jgi:hypothetical protein
LAVTRPSSALSGTSLALHDQISSIGLFSHYSAEKRSVTLLNNAYYTRFAYRQMEDAAV